MICCDRKPKYLTEQCQSVHGGCNIKVLDYPKSPLSYQRGDEYMKYNGMRGWGGGGVKAKKKFWFFLNTVEEVVVF